MIYSPIRDLLYILAVAFTTWIVLVWEYAPLVFVDAVTLNCDLCEMDTLHQITQHGLSVERIKGTVQYSRR